MNSLKLTTNCHIKYCTKCTSIDSGKDGNKSNKDSNKSNGETENTELINNLKTNLQELKESMEELQYKQNKIAEEDLKINLKEQQEVEEYRQALDRNNSGVIVSRSLQKLLSANQKSKELLKAPINNSNIEGTYSPSGCSQKYYKLNGANDSSKNQNASTEDIIIKFKQCASETRLASKFADLEAQKLRKIKEEENKKELRKKIKNKIKKYSVRRSN